MESNLAGLLIEKLRLGADGKQDAKGRVILEHLAVASHRPVKTLDFRPDDGQSDCVTGPRGHSAGDGAAEVEKQCLVRVKKTWSGDWVAPGRHPDPV